MTTSNIDQLPIELIIKIGLDPSLSLKDVASICETSSRLYRLCDSEMFWSERLKVDYPQYVPANPLPPSLTYRKYYELLYKVLNLQSSSKYRTYSVFERRIYAVAGSTDTISLVYPVPKFALYENKRMKADVKVISVKIGMSKYVSLIGYYNRKTITGSIVPTIELPANVPRLTIEEVANGNTETLRSLKYSVNRGIENFDDYYFIERKHHFRFMQAAQDAGYVAYDNDEKFDDDPDLFIRRLIVQEKKPVLGEKGATLENKPVSSRAVPKASTKKKGIFDFLSSTPDDD